MLVRLTERINYFSIDPNERISVATITNQRTSYTLRDDDDADFLVDEMRSC